jgi:hypothetical protein
VTGFDIVIGNPPYVKEATNKAAFDGLKSHLIYQGKMDLWYIFGYLSMNLAKDETGISCVIATNNWVTNDGASKFRNYILQNSKLIKFDDFGDFKVFVSAGIQTMIYLLKRSSDIKKYQVKYSRIKNSGIKRELVLDFLSSEYDFENENWKKRLIEFCSEEYIDKYISFENSSVLEKMIAAANFKFRDEEIFSGIDVLQDFVTKNHLTKISDDSVKVGAGIFVIRDGELDFTTWNENEKRKIKPFYTTSEINRYLSVKNNNYWIIYSDRELFQNIDDYPNIKRHLLKFKQIMTSVNAPFGLHRSREESIFKGDKILSIRKCSEPSFILADFDTYVSRAFLIIQTNRINLKFATAILNSKAIKYWLRVKGKMQGNNYQIDKEPLLNIPLIVPKDTIQFEILVDQILLARENDSDCVITDLEGKIDKHVYKLYNLTENEIKLIESSI